MKKTPKTGGGSTPLGVPAPYKSGTGTGVNSNGQASATGYAPNFSTFHPFLYSNGVFTDLGTLGGANGTAEGINAAGKVVGLADTAAGVNHAFLWQNGTMSDLGTLGGSRSAALDINNGGAVTGYSTLVGNELYRAFRWQNGSMTDLGTLPGYTSSFGEGINTGGTVVGEASKIGSVHAFIWDGSMNDLGVLPGDTTSAATAVNDVGQVVGTSSGTGSRASLWQASTMLDLNKLVPSGVDATLNTATAINVLGEIVGSSTQNGEQHGYMLSPIPQGQLQNVLTLINAINADRPVARRTGTGYFVARAGLLLDEGKTAEACTTIGQFNTDANQEQKGGFLSAEQAGILIEDVNTISDGLGCP